MDEEKMSSEEKIESIICEFKELEDFNTDTNKRKFKGCDCGCKQSECEMFCPSCFHNFNEKDSIYSFNGGYMCPKCVSSSEDFEKIKEKINYIDFIIEDESFVEKDCITVNQLQEQLKKFPGDMKIFITWEGTVKALEEENLYESCTGRLYIDGDGNFYKDYYQGKKALEIRRGI